MAMFDTKYPNTSRIVTGTPQLFNDDVILLCDTSAGPVTINLLEIPENFWNTNWKLYVVDNNANASVNNIVINAGVGQLINSLANITIDTDNGGAVVQIASNEAFLGNLFFTSGGAATPDEKVKVSGADTTADFLNAKIVAGAGMTLNILNTGANEQMELVSTSTGGGAITSKTNADFKVDVAASALIPNSLYLITDAGFTQGVYIRALTTNTFSREGRGIFLNLDWQNTSGNFNGVWNDTLAGLVAGTSQVAWNGEVYISTTGVNGTDPPNIDGVNWSNSKRTADPSLYVQELDWVLYDVEKNEITLRRDKRNNAIENYFENKPPTYNSLAETEFQWGNDLCYSNKAINGGVIRNANWNSLSGADGFAYNTADNNTYVDAINCNAQFVGNNMINTEFMLRACKTNISQNEFFKSVVNFENTLAGNFFFNTIQNSSVQFDAMTTGDIQENTIIESTLNGTNFQGTDVKDNYVNNARISCGTARNRVENNVVCSGSVLDVQSQGSNGSTLANVLKNNSTLLANSNQGEISGNTLNNQSTITATNSANLIVLSNNDLDNGSAISIGQWYANMIVKENVLKNVSSISSATPTGRIDIIANILTNEGRIITENAASGLIEENIITNDSRIEVDVNAGNVFKNELINDCSIICPDQSGVIKNSKMSNNSTINVTSNSGTIGQYSDANIGNVLDNSSITIGSSTQQIGGNNLTQNSSIDITTSTGTLHNMKMYAIGRLVINTLSADMGRCVISAGTINYDTISTALTRRCLYIDSSTFEIELDLNDVTVLLGTVFNIAVANRGFGIFKLINCTGKTINQIDGMNEHFNITLVNNDTSGSLRVDSTAVATASTNQLLQVGAPISNGLVGRLGVPANSDNLVLGKIDVAGYPQILQVNEFT